ncbi:MAG: AMP-binding protein, partial [Bacteroidales bacterium]|nr:AMP-binding protein [Bacteroidales bacterium]
MGIIGMRYTFPGIFEETVSKFGNRDAYAFVGEKPITYADAYKRINGLVAFLEKAGIKQGDKVALLSSNMPNWGICYFGVTFMGAIIVPILPDFSVTEITNVINHSESKLVFVSSNLLYKIDKSQLTNISTVVCTNDFSVVYSDVEDLNYDPEAKPSKKYDVKDDDIASIVYTSGTTGRSKGVMLSHKNICFNAYKGRMMQYVNENDRYLSILPLSHTYDNTLGLILSLIGGACTYYLKKPPTPSILIPALAEVRPTTILSVPLIIEKIYYGKIVPTFEKNAFIKTLYKIPPFRKIFNRIAGKKLKETFGGQMRFFGVGGAKLNTTIERFLKEAGFP